MSARSIVPAKSPAKSQMLLHTAGMLLQRKCACGGVSAHEGECEECKKKKLQRRAAGSVSGTTAPPIVHDVLRSQGQPLDAGTRDLFESRFGHDFSKVRVHADAKAAESARAVNALAYTVGSSLVFGAGRFAPRSRPGQALLAHELTHVVQQSTNAGRVSPSNLEIGREDDTAERQAENTAQTITAHTTLEGEAPRTHKYSAGGIKLQRQPETGSGDDDDYVRPWLKLGDYGIDVKPIIPGPVGAPSTEDSHKAWLKLHKKDKPADLTCPKGWQKRYGGDYCCEGTWVDLRHCCPSERMLTTGRCCPDGQLADGLDCKPDPSADLSITKDAGNAPESKMNLRVKLAPTTPLTVDLAIHFNQGQPARAVAGEKALRSSLTSRGQDELSQVLHWLKRDPNSSVQLTGMASIEGTKAQNDQLGRDRANSVANVLITSGIDVHRFSDPPGLPASCTEIGAGLHNCGDNMASPAKDENDRQVRVRLFTASKGGVVSSTSP